MSIWFYNPRRKGSYFSGSVDLFACLVVCLSFFLSICLLFESVIAQKVKNGMQRGKGAQSG